ncbi:hypothetical protein NQ317_015934, partial [Molorchus minor]
MDPLVNDNRKNGSSYSTFDKHQKTNEADQPDTSTSKTRRLCSFFSCECCKLYGSESKETVSDDIQSALDNYVQEIRSTPDCTKNKIIVPTEELLQHKVRLKCNNRTGTTRAANHEAKKKLIKSSCTNEEDHGSLLRAE